MGWFSDLRTLRAERDEYLQLWQYQKKQADSWRGIAAAMGYEGRAHLEARPTSTWILDRIARFRREVVVEEFGAMVAERLIASAGEAGTADTPQSESVHEHATEGDAQASATPPSSGTQSPPPDNTDV